jgi:hypothetical protein
MMALSPFKNAISALAAILSLPDDTSTKVIQ